LSAVQRTLVALGAAIALLALVAQLFSDGLYGTLAATPSLPRALAGAWPFAVSDALGLGRSAHLRRALARGAIVRGEPVQALALLAPLPATPEVSDLRAHAELAANDPARALRDFAAAGDFIAARSAIDALSTADPRAALVLVRDFERQLAERAAPPEIAAEVDWSEGGIAARAAIRYPQAAGIYDRESLAAFARALARAPNEEKYLLNDAFAALRLDQLAAARAAYVRAAQVVPDSIDAFVGIAVTAAAQNDCTSARTALARARVFAEQQHRTADPGTDGYAAAVLAALGRCGV
jgi:tetratricopeptide (TPR) repeat protein